MKRRFFAIGSAVMTCLTCASLLWLAPAAADCQRNAAMSASDNDSVLIHFGRVNLASTYLQPPGSLLASTVVPPTDHHRLLPDAVLWQCDAADLPNLRFLVSTNGNNRFGGYHDVGGPDGLTNVYATWFKEVGLRLTMAGVPLARTWRAVPLASYDTHTLREKGKTREVIDIRLKDIPPLHAELYRVSQKTPNVGAKVCSDTKNRNATPEGRRYGCEQPNGYIQLVGYGKGQGQDKEGEDHKTHYDFWAANNGFGYRLYQGVFLVAQPGCAVRRAPAQVKFPATSATSLNSNHTVSVPFAVQIECQNTAKSGTGHNQVSIGIQVSPGAWCAAQALKLINNAGGVTMLVSDNTGQDTTLADGVGITLADNNGYPVNFVGQSNEPITRPTSAGWYSVRYGSQKTGASDANHTLYERHYTATLGKLPGHFVTAGRIHATAQVVVKVQ